MDPTIENPTPALDDDDSDLDETDYGMSRNWTKPQSEKRQAIIADVLRKFPTLGHRTLAKKICAEHEMLFPDLECARSALRKATGNSGAKVRKYAKERRPPRKPGELPPLPESETVEWTPFVIGESRVLVLSDLHVPYHDNQAIEAALDWGEGFNPQAILFNGDVFDFYQISRFDKDPTVAGLAVELSRGNELFTHVHRRFPKARLYYKLGNHDERFDLYLMRQAPLILDIEGVRDCWHKAAGILANKITVIKDQRPIMLGHLPVFHGHELGKGISSPVNPARGAFLRAHHTILVGHHHQTSGHADTNVWHEETFCWSTGCLCDITPEYARINRWNQGFAAVTVDKSGEFNVQNMRISKGKVRSS